MQHRFEPATPALRLLSIATLLLATTGAIAQSGLDIGLGGDVETRCTIDGASAADADFSNRDDGSVSFDLYCNTEMSFSLTSLNGGLLNEARTSGGDAAQAYLHTYSATLSLRNAGFERTFTSGELADTVVVDVGGGVIFADVGRIDIRVDETLADGYSGRYTDRISVSVFPSLATALN